MSAEQIATELRQLANRYAKVDGEQSPRKRKALALESLDAAEKLVEVLKKEAGESL